MSYAQAAQGVNASNLGVQLNTVSANTRTQPPQVYCTAVADPFCQTAVLPDSKCNRQAAGIPVFQTDCIQPNMNTNIRKLQ
jgi:hypothetical protein